MDESQQNRTLDAAATRKRRSSILKCHRPPRAPFSELEFNVTTPTDTAKSRRVSFSRRTGVAEFVTNEATTTWKNFYEEHNKTAESSGNESEMNPPGASVGHLGRAMFEQQFQEVEAVDLFSTFETRCHVETSINNINFTQQIASLECLDEKKLTAPHQNFEMSAITNQSKIFGDDLAISGIGEITDRISVNFSAVQPIGMSENDELDAIQRDIGNIHSQGLPGNIIGPSPGTFGQNISEYIEIELNTTHAAIKNEESDMSITDTIHNSKVQDVSKSNPSFVVENKILNKDWVANKENILINPYIAPKETSNFAINEECDKILVFDGKRLTIQCEKENESTNRDQTHFISEEKIQRKTIVLNPNDDLPNFIDDPCGSILQGTSRSFLSGKNDSENDMSMTQPLNDNLEINSNKRKTIVYESYDGDISVTQAIPSNIILDEKSMSPHCKTLSCSLSDNVSPHSLPHTMLPESKSMPTRRNTILYEDDAGEISLTQALPSNLLLAKKCEKEDVSVKRRTIVFETDSADISITQAIPSNLVLSEKSSTASGKRKTIVVEDEAGNISITQAVPANLIFSKNGNISPKERTVVYETDMGDISLTQIVPSDLILPPKCTSMPDRRKTVIYEDNDGNLSITQAVPSNVMLPHKVSSPDKMRTVVFESENGNISITQSVGSNLIIPDINNGENNKIKSPVRAESIISEKEIINLDKRNDQETNGVKEIIETENENITKIKADEAQSILNDSDSNNLCNNCKIESPVKTESVISEKEIIKDDDTLENFQETNFVKEKLETESMDTKKINDYEKKMVLIESDSNNPCSTQTSIVKKESVNIEIDTALGNDNIINPDPKDYTMQFANSTSFSIKPKEDVHEFDVSMSEAGDVCEQKERPTNVSLNSNEKSPETLIKKRLKKTTIAFENDNETRSVSKPIPSYLALSGLEESKDSVKFSQYVPHNIVVYKADTETAHSPKSLDSMCEATPITRSYENVELTGSSNKITPKESYIKHKPSVTFKEESDTKKSILDDLLDMSNVDMADGFDDKNIMAKIESENLSEISDIQTEDAQSQVKNYKSVDGESPTEKDKSVGNDASKESLFYITKESATDVRKREETKHEDTININDSIKNNESYDLIKGIQKKLERFKKQVDEDCSLNHRVESVISADLVTDKKASEPNYEPVSPKVITKQTKTSNDTNDLLDWISEFTDREEEKNPVTEVQSSAQVTVAEGMLAIEDKSNSAEGRVSLLPKRQSMVLSREDLMNNISMAQAVLQKSRAEIEVSEVVDDTETTSIASTDQINRATQSKKMVRVSNEVVKKLHFEEDFTFSEDSYGTSEFQRGFSPVKKTAFGEESYMKDNKANVIPTYLKDVSDGIKQLITDLVKPTADTLPFETVRVDKGVRKAPSTSSIQVQANLMASSQIDVTQSESICKIPRSSFSSDREENVKKIVQFIPEEQTYEPEVASVIPSLLPAPPVARRQEADRVIMFDHNNPLNNVLLAPIDFSEVHSYNPVRSEEAVNEVSAHAAPKPTDDTDSCKDNIVSNICIQRITIEKECYAVNYVKTASVAMQCEAQESESESENKSVPESVSVKKSITSEVNSGSSNSKPQSLNQSFGALVVEMKDIEVNTAIVMKSTEELLQNSSSLTLVDDTVSRSRHLVTTGNAKLMYKMEEREEDEGEELQKTESVHASPDRARKFSPDRQPYEKSKGHKRVHSPKHKKNHKNSTLESLEVTPKPASKIQKTNDIPPSRPSGRQTRAPDYDSTTSQSESGKESRSDSRSPDSRRSPRTQKRSPRKLKLSPKEQGAKVPAVTVQRVKTEYIIDSDPVNVEVFKKSHLTDVSEESDAVSQSQAQLLEKAQSMSLASPSESARSGRSEGSRSKAYSMEWQPELVNELSSKNLVAECESGINVVAKIDTLPFMGSRECEWKSASSDTWVFKLLHGRLRLSVRLAHRHDNLARTLVRADTPVLHVQLDRSHHENKNPVAVLCVRFAKEAMRHIIRRGISCAGEVPALLRACAGVARVALQWGRAMHDAYRHLAFSLSEDGTLELKVANIPLRSVWEVTMRIALEVEEGREIPWPQASGVDVTAVVSDFPVSPQETARALEGLRRDWSHAPRTVWRIFKYLKSKSTDQDLLFFSGR